MSCIIIAVFIKSTSPVHSVVVLINKGIMMMSPMCAKIIFQIREISSYDLNCDGKWFFPGLRDSFFIFNLFFSLFISGISIHLSFSKDEENFIAFPLSPSDLSINKHQSSWKEKKGWAEAKSNKKRSFGEMKIEGKIIRFPACKSVFV